MKVLIKYEKEIENCYQCPFKEWHSEQGFCADCCKFINYGKIPRKGILKKCPFITDSDFIADCD